LQGHFTIWVLPTYMKVASQKAAALLRNTEFDVLFLNLQRDLEGFVEALAEGAPYEWFMDRLQELKLLREPISSWEYRSKPILTVVRGLKQKRPNFKVWCYKQLSFAQLTAELAEKIARLVFRLISTGKMYSRDWRNLLQGFVEASSDAIEDEAKYIMERFDPNALSICISDFYGRDLKEKLKRGGLDAGLDYIFLPYHFTPLEILVRECGKERSKGLTMSDCRLFELAKAHAEFIRGYVVTSEDYDEAYFRWLHDEAKWLRLPT